jgi:DNA-binding MarR family transcriptional regulator
LSRPLAAPKPLRYKAAMASAKKNAPDRARLAPAQEAAFQQLVTIGCTGMGLRHVARAVTVILDRHLKPAGIQITQFAPLAYLYERGALSMGALAELVGVDPTTLTRLVHPLEQRGLIQAVTGEDRRRRLLVLTQAGLKSFARALPLWREGQREIAEKLGKSETSDLVKRLERARARLGP